MKIKLENIGGLREADLTLADLTVITGENNTGKSSIAFALHGLLWMHPECVDFGLDDKVVEAGIREGTLELDLRMYINRMDDILQDMCDRYVSQLDRVMYMPSHLFEDTKMSVQLDHDDMLNRHIDGTIRFDETRAIRYEKMPGSMQLKISFRKIQELIDATNWGVDSPQFNPLKSLSNTIISHAMLSHLLPCPFTSTADRAGVVMFHDQITFSSSSYLDNLAQKDRDVDLSRLLRSGYPRYPLPIREGIEFIQEIQTHKEYGVTEQHIARTHKHILDEFSTIVGGDYYISSREAVTMDNKQVIYFVPKGSKDKRRLSEWSSAMKNLAELGLWLRYGATPGQLLIVENPELGLHPANQMWIARLFAQLVNAGVKVLVVTHSDYIVKELNTLLMLNNDLPHCKRIAQENRYLDNELLLKSQVRAYETKQDLVEPTGGGKRKWQSVLTECDVDQKIGIEVKNFDRVIDNMNKILEDIVWGAE